MLASRALALSAILLLASTALAQSLAQEVTPVLEKTQPNPSSSLANTSLVLLGGSPQFTLSADTNCTTGGSGDVSACSPRQWLAVALRNVYEIDDSGNAVAERSGSTVLNVDGVAWQAQDVQLGNPAVAGFQGAMRLPYKQSLQPCPGTTAPTAGPTSGGVTLTAQLFGGLTNVTYAGSSLELLPGNVKWSALVENWPWCGSSHRLVLGFGLLPANPSAAAGPVLVENGTDVQQRVAEEQALLTGAADPESVPVADSSGNSSSTTPPTDPAAAGTGSRRLLGFSFGGIKFGSSKPATKPTSKPPTSTSSKPATKPTSKPPTSTSGPATKPTSKPPTSTSGPATRPSSKPPTGTTFSPTRPPTKPSTSSTTAKPYRPYFPAGGSSRPRYSTPAAALGALPFAATQRPYLDSRFWYNRPVYGFGRRPALPYSTFLFFPLLYGASQSGRYEKAPAVDMQKAAMLNNSTVANVSVEVQPVEEGGVQPVLVTLPHFEGSALYDPVASISESDLAVTEGIQASIDDVMAYDRTSNGSPAAVGHAVMIAALAAVATALLL